MTVNWITPITGLPVTVKLSLSEILGLINSLLPAEREELIIECLAQDDELSTALLKYLESE